MEIDFWCSISRVNSEGLISIRMAVGEEKQNKIKKIRDLYYSQKKYIQSGDMQEE
jgi:hypothetical protein